MEPEKKQTSIALPQESKKFLQNCSKATKNFYYFHGVQLFGSQFPIDLIETLHEKLEKVNYDAGDYLELFDNQQIESFEVKAKKDIPALSNVFIIDHALTFRYPDFRRLVMENSSLIPRLKQILKYHKNLKQLPNIQQIQNKPIGVAGNFTQIQFDNMGLTQLSHLQFPNNTVTLSLINNQLTDQTQFIKKLQYLDLKILWLNNNPIQDSQNIIDYILNSTKIEVFNSKFTKNCTQWGIKYVQQKTLNYAFNQLDNNVRKLNLDDRGIFLMNISILEKFTNLSVLSLKGHDLTNDQHQNAIIHILDNNKSLKFVYLDYEAECIVFDLFTEKKISKETAGRVLINGHSLFCKETTLLQNQIDDLQETVFKLTGNYRLASSEKLDQSSIWYMNDEVGSAIQHSDQGNVKLIPFLFAEDNKMGENMIAYSLIWPLKDIKAGDTIYRDYLNGISQEKDRSSRLAIWYELPINFYQNKIREYDLKLMDLQKASSSKIINFYKQNTQKQRQFITKQQQTGELYPQSMKVVTDNYVIEENLTLKSVKLVKNLEEADILWMSGAVDEQKWSEIIDKYYFNQFPFQSAIVMKHHLADTVQSILGNTTFLMRTYNLERQLPQFIGDYKKRQKLGQDNLWIIKPPNMARSMDMIITDNLSLIVKCMQTGPKIVQKYIERPILRKGRKVDLRYIVLLKSVSPLTMFLYKNFWIRSSNNHYTTDRRYLSTYQTQFTVMNYGNVTDFKQIPYKQFIDEFQKDYSPTKWAEIDDKIKKMLRNTLIAAALKYPKMHNEKSRAIYGIDVMVDQITMQPKLLEITFSPDCKRACQYYPTFYNQVFETLFLNTIGQNMERII